MLSDHNWPVCTVYLPATICLYSLPRLYYPSIITTIFLATKTLQVSMTRVRIKRVITRHQFLTFRRSFRIRRDRFSEKKPDIEALRQAVAGLKDNDLYRHLKVKAILIKILEATTVRRHRLLSSNGGSPLYVRRCHYGSRRSEPAAY